MRRGRSPRGSVDRNVYRFAHGLAPVVAPHAGAWIETRPKHWRASLRRSLPTRERGSKRPHPLLLAAEPRRSPRGSVDRNQSRSIASNRRSGRSPRGSVDRNRKVQPADAGFRVAPHAGAWIETRHWRASDRSAASLPTRERGSKLVIAAIDRLFAVAPHAGAWIETFEKARLAKGGGSLPTRERGSKRRWRATVRPQWVAPHAGAWIETRPSPSTTARTRSLPTRERGSKLGIIDHFSRTDRVAPHAGAWIETSPMGSVPAGLTSLPTRERGSKPRKRASPPVGTGRSPRGSVDRNSSNFDIGPAAPVAPHAGAWIETPGR